MLHRRSGPARDPRETRDTGRGPVCRRRGVDREAALHIGARRYSSTPSGSVGAPGLKPRRVPLVAAHVRHPRLSATAGWQTDSPTTLIPARSSGDACRRPDTPVVGQADRVAQASHWSARRSRCGDRSRDVAHRVVDHVVHQIHRVGVGRLPGGREAPTLIDGDVDENRPLLHRSAPCPRLPAWEPTRRGPGPCRSPGRRREPAPRVSAGSNAGS